MTPRNLIIGPGAMAFFLFLGQMSRLDLTHVKAVSGASAGGLLALLWVAARGDIPEMLDFALHVPIKTLMRPNLKNLLGSDFGLVPLARVRKLISEIFKKYFKKTDLTFKELRDLRPVDLYIPAFCVDLGRTEYFSWRSHPTQSVLDVVCATIAVPLVFSSVLIGPWRYIDGAFQEEIPGAPFMGQDPSLTLALRTDRGLPNTTKNLQTFIMNILQGALRMRHTYNVPTLLVNPSDLDLFDFGADRLRLFCNGQKSWPLVNDSYHSIRVRHAPEAETDLREGDDQAQVVLVRAQGGPDPRASRPDQGCGGHRQEPQGDRPVEEGHVDLVRVPPGRGADQSSQGPDQGGL